MSLFSLPRTKPPFPHYCLPHQLLHVNSLSSLAIQWNLLNQFQWFDTKQNLSKYLTKNVIFFPYGNAMYLVQNDHTYH